MHDQTYVAPTSWAENADPTVGEATRSELEKRFVASCTSELRRRATRFAGRRLEALRVGGYSNAVPGADELVNDALADIWIRLDAWRPAERSLLSEVTSRLRHLLWRERRSASRQLRWFGERVNDDIIDEVPVEEDSLETDQVRARVVLESLGERAGTASDEAAILMCWEQHVVERDEILATTKLQPDRYKAALRRLRRWARNLHACEP